ncbi:SIMPL domain-containing protein [Flavobacterium sp. MC2016-06]|jgi:predicted secreted protein|uniref:SIMPL domain-containing protein n=1 Tax=Flavobacterium sp. MC2016-06 TaxID=2676308 RepID=UPI0012BAF520|nr:SIMPL domain-containing protein [Flavobacterium sp. MC2016-06]MBU3861395.1 SIMPL domain-containing protein [Flavobacterium sp. MC2016-06]
MRKLFFTILALPFCQFIIAQASGNVNYQNQIRYSNNTINVDFPSDSDVVISVKGLTNVKADAYVAIFSTTQTGKTTQEVNELIDKRITQSLNEIKLKKSVETFVDMISFVPVYEYEVEKKVFSRKTYNEVPVGFELKKNIHIKFTDPNQLNDFITILSNHEIYDLVRVDYFSSALEIIKKEMMTKAKLLVQEKMKNYEALLGETFTNAEKKIIDDYNVTLPVEMYRSYEAYNSSSLNLKKAANVNQVSKSTTLYYQPIFNKEFDFVINSTVLEPVIQVQYEVKIAINREKEKKPISIAKADKEYILVTPNGDLKTLNINTPKQNN